MGGLTIEQVDLAKVTLFHNVARDENGRSMNLFGYEDGHPLVRVFEFEINTLEFHHHGPAAAERIAQYAMDLANGHPTDEEAGKLSQLYYGRRLRSFSVGDVVMISTLRLACASVGWKALLRELNEITDRHQGEHGTQPLRTTAA